MHNARAFCDSLIAMTIAFYDATMRRSGHQGCFEVKSLMAGSLILILVAIISEKYAFNVKEINTEQLDNIAC